MKSAGLLLYRDSAAGLEVFLVHPGGPFFARKDKGVWSVPKGLIEEGEEPWMVARREFAEETGLPVEEVANDGDPIPLGTIRQRGGKIVEAWALPGEWPEGREVASNMFEIEWPPSSGRKQSFPEVDQGRFFTLGEARERMVPAQVELLDRLLEALGRK